MGRHLFVLVVTGVISGCAASGYSTAATKQLETDILKAITAHGMATQRKYNYIDVPKQPLESPAGTLNERWSVREQWTDRWAHYSVSMTPDENGETDFAVREIKQATNSE